MNLESGNKPYLSRNTMIDRKTMVGGTRKKIKEGSPPKYATLN